ncbi:PAS domain-containing protein [Candidatus Saganbacteria bacterium]|nr:PAS domain-containing protein [Candidatus Saganbacteria bacterium]
MSMFFSYFELAAALFILLTSFNMYSRHYENRSARFFARFALVAFLSALFEYSLRIAFTLDLARDINRICGVLLALTFAMFLHFVLVFTKKDGFLNKKVNFILFYLPVIIVSAVFIFTNWMYSYYEITHIGIVSQPSFAYLIFAAQTIIYLSIGIVLLFAYSRKAPQKTVRNQALIIAIGSLVPTAIGVTTDQLLPVFMGARLFWPTVVFDLALMNIFIYFAMRQYSLFAISPSLAADIIIETMPDSLIVTDLDGTVILVNDEAHKFFHAPKEDILGKPIFKLFVDRAKYDQLYKEVVNKNLEIERYQVDLCDPLGECIPSLINANKIHDAIGETLGVVYIIRDKRG